MKSNNGSIIFVFNKIKKEIVTKQFVVIKEKEIVNMKDKKYINLKYIFPEKFKTITTKRNKIKFSKIGYLDITDILERMTDILERKEELTNIPIYLSNFEKKGSHKFYNYIYYYDFKPHDKAKYDTQTLEKYYTFTFENIAVNKPNVSNFLSRSKLKSLKKAKTVSIHANKTKHKSIKNMTI